MQLTNAQAALQAACTVFTGKDASPNTVQGLAMNFKRWLDRQDLEAKEPEVSHHITCASRKVLMGRTALCDCTPVPYTTNVKPVGVFVALPEYPEGGRVIPFTTPRPGPSSAARPS